MSDEKKMELAPLGENALGIKDMLSVFEEEMDGLGTIPLQRVTTPAGGGLAFTIGDDDDAEVVKDLVGVIVCHNATNVYYERSIEDSDGDCYPTCASADGKTGFVRETGEVRSCDTCPRNQFGADGRKECSNRHNVYLLREGDMLPMLISLPSTSLGNFKKLIAQQVVLKQRRCTSIVVKATLEKAESRGGQPFSRYKWAVVRELDPQDAAKMAAYGADFKAFVGTVDRNQQQPVQKTDAVTVDGDDFDF